MANYSYEIGTTLVGMVNVEDLVVTPKLKAPRHTWKDYSVAAPLASGRVRGGGWPIATWTWDFLYWSQYNFLRTNFCAGKSAEIYIATRIDDGTYDDFLAFLVWPEERDTRRDIVLDFTLTFRILATA